MPGTYKTLFLSFLIAASLCGGTALAQESDDDAKPVSQPRSARLTAAQLQSFADLTGDSAMKRPQPSTTIRLIAPTARHRDARSPLRSPRPSSSHCSQERSELSRSER